MDVVIYHSRDLDGVASAAIAKIAWPECELIGYDYGEDIDLRRFKTKKVLMVDVSLKPDRMISLSRVADLFVFVDHHVGVFKEIRQEMELEEKTRENDINDLIYLIQNRKMNYYFSERLSACEMMLVLFGNDEIDDPSKEAIRLLGQYDTWRNSYEKQLSGDRDWDLEVMPFQWGMRGSLKPDRLVRLLNDLSDWRTNTSVIDIIKKGFAVLSYQSDVDKVNFEKFGFEFDLFVEGFNYRVLGLNGGPFNSNTFRSVWNPEYHDIMMPFIYNGKTKQWNFSLYTTKPDIDILSIAKSYDGGGHAMACGFQLEDSEVEFRKGSINFNIKPKKNV